jgi:cysteine dioxygenase
MSLTDNRSSVPREQTQVSIQEFVAALQGLDSGAYNDIGGILEFLRSHRIAPETLTPYLTWNQKYYTRNLIDRTPSYQLLAICWEKGQGSSIHDHQGQNCWMAVPLGRLMVQNYRVLSQDLQAGTCELVSTDKLEMNSSNPAAVDLHYPVHRVYNPIEFDDRAVSVHLYSRPFDSCMAYSLEQGTCRLVNLEFTTRYGQGCPKP